MRNLRIALAIVAPALLITLLAFIAAVASVLFLPRDSAAATGAMARPLSRTHTPTNTPTRRPTSTPTDTPTPSNTPTPTGTTVPGATMTSTPTPFAMAVKLWSSTDPTMIAILNTSLRTSDEVHGISNALTPFAQVPNVRHTLVYTTPTTLATQIAVAKGAGITVIDLDEEGPACATLVPDEQYAESQAHAQGMTFIWGGTGRSLASCYTQILPYSDVAYYQTEYL